MSGPGRPPLVASPVAVGWPRRPALYLRRGERHATWLELFFDLVLVLAIAQLGQYLHDHLTPAGALGFVFLFLPVWSAWMGYAYYADLFDVDGPAYRVTLLGAMLLSVALAVTLPGALDGGSAAFAAAYAALRAVLVGLYVWAWRSAPLARPLSARYTAALTLGVLLWLASLLVPEPARYGLWVAGLLVEMTAPYLIQRSVLHDVPAHTSHFPERLGLFTMLVLGESVVVTGTAVAGTAWDARSALTAALGFVAVACLWWLYFDRVDEEAVARAYARGVGALGWGFVWAYGHLFVYAGLAAMAVGIAGAIEAAAAPGADGEGAAGAAAGVALGVGTALALLAITAVQSLAPSAPDRLVLAVRCGVALLALVVAAGAAWLTPPALAGLLALGLAGLTTFEVRRRARPGGPDASAGDAPAGDAPAGRRAPATGAAGGAAPDGA